MLSHDGVPPLRRESGDGGPHDHGALHYYSQRMAWADLFVEPQTLHYFLQQPPERLAAYVHVLLAMKVARLGRYILLYLCNVCGGI